ncbi:MAG TPA: hypothetical protein VIX37_15210 [Candidatus Sulfotelmatobacter sp.]
MMNIYTGNVTTNEQGEATVQLPEWFEVLNTDFRYQLTVIGVFAQAIIGHEIQNHEFTIRTTHPMGKFPGRSRGCARMRSQRRIRLSWKKRRTRGYAVSTFIPNFTDNQERSRSSGLRHPELMKRSRQRPVSPQPHSVVKPATLAHALSAQK